MGRNTVIVILLCALTAFFFYVPTQDGKNIKQWEDAYTQEKSQYNTLLSQYNIKQTQDTTDSAIANDAITLAENNNTMINLCENKYQDALSGKLGEALIIEGQIEAIRAQNDSILQKYDTSPSPAPVLQ